MPLVYTRSAKSWVFDVDYCIIQTGSENCFGEYETLDKSQSHPRPKQFVMITSHLRLTNDSLEHVIMINTLTTIQGLSILFCFGYMSLGQCAF
jgi:hypothetical protein